MNAPHVNINPETIDIGPISRVSSGIELLSRKEGLLALPEEDRKYCALFEDGYLYAARGHLNTSKTLNLMVRSARILGEDTKIKIIETTMKEIEEAYLFDPNQIKRALIGGKKVTGDAITEATTLLHSTANHQDSDIHITVTREGTQVERRHLGDIISHTRYTEDMGDRILRALFDSCENRGIEYQNRNYQVGQLYGTRITLPKNINAIRCNFSPLDMNGRYLVLRLLYTFKTTGIDLQALGYDEGHVKLLQKHMDQGGINLISGPTGAGKSTSLRDILLSLAERCKRSKKIIMAEDPSEYVMPDWITQLSIPEAYTSSAISEAWEETFRAILRSDPDVVVPGEIRGAIAGKFALDQARTGHTVYSTIHATSALGIFERLEKMGLLEQGIYSPNTVKTLWAQCLVKQLCPKCAEPCTSGSVRKEVQNRMASIGLFDFDLKTKGEGCQQCQGEGYSGRTLITEGVETDQKLMSLMINSKVQKARDYWVKEHGGQSLIKHGLNKVRQGLVDYQDLEKTVGRLYPEIIEAHHAK